MSEKLIYIKSYGCQMNVYDSNRIKDLFLDKGYKITDDVKKANLTVLNTCHIREKAVEKVYSDIGRIKKIKDINKDMQLVVAGCVAQAEGNEIKKRSPVVDFVVGPQSYHKLVLRIQVLLCMGQHKKSKIYHNLLELIKTQMISLKNYKLSF